MTPDPGSQDGYEEKPFYCPGHFTERHCPQAVGMMVSHYGRVVGLRIPTLTGGSMLVRSLHGVCEGCGEPVVFVVSDTVLRQVLLELQALNVL